MVYLQQFQLMLWCFINFKLVLHVLYQAREKDLQKQLASLQSLIDELRQQIKQKDEQIVNLENDIKSQVYCISAIFHVGLIFR